MNNILVVCIGNICRSPVAEAMLKVQLPGRNIWSAGLHAVVGHAADERARTLAERDGFDLTAHRAQQLTAWMCSHADLILVMESKHRLELGQKYPTAMGKTRCLGEFGRAQPFEISDPYGESQEAFDSAHAGISLGVAEWARRIKMIF